MQTFLPYTDPAETAKVLDRQRLGKQRVEGLQIIRTLAGISTGWRNHPAVKMWDGHLEALADYTMTICEAWIARGYKDTCKQKIIDIVGDFDRSSVAYPEWLFLEELVLSHKSNLIRKLPEHYGILWPTVPNDLPYVWPV